MSGVWDGDLHNDTGNNMMRRLLTVASAISLLLCVGALLVLLCSFLAFAPFGQSWTTSWDGNGGGYVVRVWFATHGTIHLLLEERTVSPTPTSNPNHYHHSGIEPLPGVVPPGTTLGFLWERSLTSWPEPGTGRRITFRIEWFGVPLWLLALLLAVAPVAQLSRQMRRHSRSASGHCATCGYDLRASKNRCPECGTPIPLKATA
jgi:hypothetical protein